MASDHDALPRRRDCGTMPVHAALAERDPRYRENRRELEAFTLDHANARSMGARAKVVSIPVVVHVVAATPAQDISDTQVRSQITILSRDYRKRNRDARTIPAPFKPFAVDTRIEFALAVRDPKGNATTGITRTQTAVAAFTQDEAVKFTARGGKDAWPRDKYLNIWVCELAGTLLGYAQFPGGPSATDGVVIRHSAFGNVGTAEAPFDRGRTTVHEVGHWLNLLHIWGDDGSRCSGSDNVADTPNCASENYGTPTFPHVTCRNGPDGDMFMNYMDYVDDAAMFMFTAGQLARMQLTLAGPRAALLLSDALTPPHTTPAIALPRAGAPPLVTRDLVVATDDSDAVATRGLDLTAVGSSTLVPPTEAGTPVTHVFDGVGWVPVGAVLPRGTPTARAPARRGAKRAEGRYD